MKQTQSRTKKTALLLAAALVVAGGAWLLFGRGRDFAAEADVLHQELLSADVSPQQRRVMLATLMRYVDKLDSTAQRHLQSIVREQWREIQRQDMDAYYAAATVDRRAVLDRGLDRLLLISDLADVFYRSGSRVRQPRSRTTADTAAATPRPHRPPAPDPATAAARRKAMEAYATALEKRARERGIDMSALALRPQRG